MNSRENIDKKTLRFLVAPLDWGLGHVSRCVPLIEILLNNSIEVIVACNERQKLFLSQEFPSLQFVNLEGYNIRYGKKKLNTFLKIIFQIPKIIFAIHRERKWLNQFLQNNAIDCVVSDNRYGFCNKNVYSVFITHQLKIKTGTNFLFENILQKIIYQYINRFDECWVPDYEGENNLAGELSHPRTLPNISTKYIGILSRLKPNFNVSKNENYIFISLSGPEPQRSIFENLIIKNSHHTSEKIILLRGLLEGKIDEEKNIHPNLTLINHCNKNKYCELLVNSKLIIARSGYSTIMDLVACKKSAILIPTPAQTEQEYLANYLSEKKYFMQMAQHKFNFKNIFSQFSERKTEIFDLPNTNLLEQAIVDLLRKIK